MGLLTKLKSLLGLDEDRSQVRRGDTGVTIEREPGESAESRDSDRTAEPDAETESAVKGVDSSESDTSGGVEAVTEAEPERTQETEDASDEPEKSNDTTDETTAEAETGVTTEDVTTESEAESAPSQTDEAAEPEAAEDTEAEPTPDTEQAPESTEDESVADEKSADDERADEPAAEGEPLDDIKGIGPAYADRLQDAGVADVAELATADADALAEETGLSAKRISGWIERAKNR